MSITVWSTLPSILLGIILLFSPFNESKSERTEKGSNGEAIQNVCNRCFRPGGPDSCYICNIAPWPGGFNCRTISCDRCRTSLTCKPRNSGIQDRPLINSDFRLDVSTIRTIAQTSPRFAAVLAEVRNEVATVVWHQVHYPPINLVASDIEYWLRDPDDAEVKAYFKSFETEARRLFNQGKSEVIHVIEVTESEATVTITLTVTEGNDPEYSPYTKLVIISSKQNQLWLATGISFE